MLYNHPTYQPEASELRCPAGIALYRITRHDNGAKVVKRLNYNVLDLNHHLTREEPKPLPLF